MDCSPKMSTKHSDGCSLRLLLSYTSIKTPVFVDRKTDFRAPSIKTPVFVDKVHSRREYLEASMPIYTKYQKNNRSMCTIYREVKKRPDRMIRSMVVEIVGVEPTTPCLQSRCSSQLSYTPRKFKNLVVPSRLELLTPTLSV